MLLRTGQVGASANEVAFELLSELGGLAGLLGATPQLLLRRGLGPAKAATLLAAAEIGRRLAPLRAAGARAAHPARRGGALSGGALPAARPGGDGSALPGRPQPAAGRARDVPRHAAAHGGRAAGGAQGVPAARGGRVRRLPHPSERRSVAEPGGPRSSPAGWSRRRRWWGCGWSIT